MEYQCTSSVKREIKETKMNKEESYMRVNNDMKNLINEWEKDE